MKTPAVLATFVLGLAGAACKMGPVYQRPAQPMPAAYPGQPAQAGPAFPDLAWFEVFHDPVLQDLIRAALAQNADLRIAANRVLQTEVQVGIARSYLSPTVGTQSQAGRGIDSLDRAFMGPRAAPGNQYVVNMGVSWEVDFWGKVRSQTDVARANLVASEENRNLVLQTLVTGLAQAYFQLRELDAELDIARRTLASRKASLDLMRMRYEGGVSSLSDANQAESLVQSAAHALPLLEGQVAQQEAAINVLLGRFGEPVPRGLALDDQKLAVDVPPGLPSDLLERRPDVRMAEAKLVAANAQIGVAKAQFFPSIGLTATKGFASAALDGLFTPGAAIWSVGASICSTIFQGGRLTANLKLTELQKEEMVLQYAKAAQQAFADASTSLVALGKTRQARQEQEAFTRTLELQMDLAGRRYEAGVAAYLEVQDAERQCFEARRGLAQAKRDELLAVLALYKSLGGGWSKGA